jgi:DNA-directed RNA polymerase subunit M/transcription elongation factor TFIIS
MKFCPDCRYYLYLQINTNESDGTEMMRQCRNCGYKEAEKGGLVFETNMKETTSESYKLLLNEFTRLDPTLPHVNNIKCVNQACASRTNEKDADVIYMKYDAVNMKYLYICNVCGEQWKSKS